MDLQRRQVGGRGCSCDRCSYSYSDRRDRQSDYRDEYRDYPYEENSDDGCSCSECYSGSDNEYFGSYRGAELSTRSSEIPQFRVRSLEPATSSSRPSRRPTPEPPRRAPVSPYKTVHVLTMVWDSHDLKTDDRESIYRSVDEEAQEVRRTFGTYNYTTEGYKIPMTDSARRLRRAIRNAAKGMDSSDELLIIYYNGHGGLEDRTGVLRFYSHKTRGSKFSWHDDLWPEISDLECNVLVILDSCHAGAAIPKASRASAAYDRYASKRGPDTDDDAPSKEVIGTSTFETGSVYGKKYSFAPIMKDAFRERKAAGRSFDTASFTRDITRRMMEYYQRGERGPTSVVHNSLVTSAGKISLAPLSER